MWIVWRGRDWLVELRCGCSSLVQNDGDRAGIVGRKAKSRSLWDDNKKDKDNEGDIDWIAIEMKFSFCSLLTEGVVYERSQGSDEGEESGY